MIVIVSDIHMTDRHEGSAVKDHELTMLMDEVEHIRLQLQDECLEIVLLGDIIDFIRSPEWHSSGTRPWRKLNGQFEAFANSEQERTALEIANSVYKRYSQFSIRLKTLKDSPNVHVHYVVGNHDYILNLSQKLRASIIDFMSIDWDPTKIFPSEYTNRELGLVALHGNQCDEMNIHKKHEGVWAIGDAIVIDLINEFGRRSCEVLKLSPKDELYNAVHEVDNVVPIHYVPYYVHWLATSRLFSRNARQLKEVWKAVVDDFIEIVKTDGLTCPPQLKLALKASKSFPNKKLLKIIKKIDKTKDENYANKLAIRDDNPVVVVLGHTHTPGVHTLPRCGEQKRYYINTGSWRQALTCPRNVKYPEFISHRVSAMFVAFEGQDYAQQHGRFHLVSRWHLN